MEKKLSVEFYPQLRLVRPQSRGATGQAARCRVAPAPRREAGPLSVRGMAKQAPVSGKVIRERLHLVICPKTDLTSFLGFAYICTAGHVG